MTAEKADRMGIVTEMENIARQVKAIGDLLGAAGLGNNNVDLKEDTLDGIGSILEELGNKLDKLSEEI